METIVGNVYRKLFELNKVRNQADFARQLGYQRSFINRLIHSTSAPEAALAKSIEETFGVSPLYLALGSRSGVDVFGEKKEVQAASSQAFSVSSENADKTTADEDSMLQSLIKAEEDRAAAARDTANALLIMAKNGAALTQMYQQSQEVSSRHLGKASGM